MRGRRGFEIFLIICFGLFSWWLMWKSFGYDSSIHRFRIARHQVGDFGLHLSLARSFSWGSNFSFESPFFPGQSLPYHYYFDFLVGILERVGVRIDVAMNGFSAIAFTFLLSLIYLLSQILFGKDKKIGVLSVLFFIFPSNLTFIDFFGGKTFSPMLMKEFWFLPDYLHKGPFDGSIISIFFTLNTYLNQRHLIMGLVISLAILIYIINRLLKNQIISMYMLTFLGMLLGFSTRIHTLIAISSLVVICMLFIVFQRRSWIFPICLSAFLVFSFHLNTILAQDTHALAKALFHPGFLAEAPLTFYSFLKYWIANLGVAILLIPLGFIWSNVKQKKVFISFFVLFAIANTFQLSYRIDHNHSLVNFFLIVANVYVAFVFAKLWRKGLGGKLVSSICFGLLIISGVINLMAVKNDFQYPLNDAPANPFMEWIKENSRPNDIFLSRQEILDPVTLSGRRNYFGHTYYLSVMGYDMSEREKKTKDFFEARDQSTLTRMREEGIGYVVIPVHAIVDFHYDVHADFFDRNLPIVYRDRDVLVYKL